VHEIAHLSDLHLAVHPLERPGTDADVIVLAGDIARPRDVVEWALGFTRPVVYVAGNHEFYGGSIDGTLAGLARLCEETHVQLLDDSESSSTAVRFLGPRHGAIFRNPWPVEQ
jgi:predicted phosphodiesterase